VGTSGAQTRSVAGFEAPATFDTYSDMPATVGPSVTVVVPPSGIVLVTVTAHFRVHTQLQSTAQAYMSFASSGPTLNLIPADERSVFLNATFSGQQGFVEVKNGASATFLVGGLGPGANTFVAKYRGTQTGQALIGNRTISVIPIG
jgi:hypothetical protein